MTKATPARPRNSLTSHIRQAPLHLVYTGVVVPINSSEIHVIRYSSQYISNAPASIDRINANTGAYLGTASYTTGTCGSSATRSIHDADVYNGNVYTAHYSYYMVNKWEVGWNQAGTQVQWVCKNSYNYQYPNYITGVDFDDETGKMYISTYDNSAQNHYLKEVNPASPTVVTGTWLMTSTSYYYDHGAGLSVSMPNVMYNIYYMQTDYKSVHHHFTMASGLLSSQGERLMPGGGHYGIVDTDDHKVMFSCHWSSTSYCSQGLRKIHTYGDGAHYDVRSTSQTSQLIVGQTTSISRAINSINVEGIFGSTPTGTSIRVDVSNDGGVTWKSGSVGQKVNFVNAGTSIKWRATLNGSASKTPVLGDVVLTYTTNYQTSGWYYAYQYTGSGSSNVIAATVDWNETSACRHQHFCERRLQGQFIGLQQWKLWRANVHLSQHDEIHDRVVVLLLCPHHALYLLHRGHTEHHRLVHCSALQCTQSTRIDHRRAIRLQALCSRRRPHRTAFCFG